MKDASITMHHVAIIETAPINSWYFSTSARGRVLVVKTELCTRRFVVHLTSSIPDGDQPTFTENLVTHREKLAGRHIHKSSRLEH